MSIAAALIPAVLGYSIVYSMYGLFAVGILRLLFALLVLSRYATFQFKFAQHLENLKLSTPLILSLFVSGSAEYIDGVIVKSKFNDMFFAIYRYGAKELPVLLIVANTFSTAMIPTIAANLEDGLKELREKSTRLMHWFFPITIVLMLSSHYIYKYVFNESFEFSAIIFNIYLLLIIPRVLFPQTILTAIQKPGFVLVSSILEIVINVSLSLYLSDPTRLGLSGIAVGTFVAYSFDKIFLALVCKFYFKIDLKKYVQLIPYFVYVILTFVSFFLSQKIALTD
ncbi:MAG: hypothetical protein JWO06_3905 [Bacteroidota bacterium]|nr:hypothetical protein [Bacteroidota bacterium]